MCLNQDHPALSILKDLLSREAGKKSWHSQRMAADIEEAIRLVSVHPAPPAPGDCELTENEMAATNRARERFGFPPLPAPPLGEEERREILDYLDHSIEWRENEPDGPGEARVERKIRALLLSQPAPTPPAGEEAKENPGPVFIEELEIERWLHDAHVDYLNNGANKEIRDKIRAILSQPKAVTREFIDAYVNGHWPDPGILECFLKPRGVIDLIVRPLLRDIGVTVVDGEGK